MAKREEVMRERGWRCGGAMVPFFGVPFFFFWCVVLEGLEVCLVTVLGFGVGRLVVGCSIGCVGICTDAQFGIQVGLDHDAREGPVNAALGGLE